MANYDTWYNLLTGLSQGAFDRLEVRDASGSMVNILTLLNTGSITDVQATSPLTVATSSNVRTLGINLGSYSTSAQTTSEIATALLPYFTGAQLSLILTAYSSTLAMNSAISAATTSALVPFSTTVQAAAATTAALAPYTSTTALTTLLAAKHPLLSATTDLSVQDITCRFLQGGSAGTAFTITQRMC